MIPLRDNIPSRTFPFVTIAIIIINTLVFLYELSLGKQLDQLVRIYSIIPTQYISGSAHYDLSRYLPLFSSMFLHGGWLHLIGNMYFLWIFGDNVEDRVGHFKFIIFYLLCGLAAGFTHIYTNPHSHLPTVGASGAIAGVLGAYLLLYPRARVLTLVPLGFFLDIIELPALIFLGFWFIIQFFNGFFAIALVSREIGGVAWWAHIGGFIFGLFIVNIFKKRNYYRRPYFSE